MPRGARTWADSGRHASLGPCLQNGRGMKLRALLPAASLSASTIAALAAPADAQEAMPPPPPPPAPAYEPMPALAPGLFPTMGPDGSATSIGAQLAFLTGEGDTIKRFDLQAQYVSPGGMGGYATIAGSTMNDASALGSLELGALWARRGNGTDVAVRAGVVLPTASGDTDLGDGDDALIHLFGTAFSRPSDLLAAAPDTTTLRVAVSPTMRNNNFVARADIGVDIVVDSEGEGPESPFLHADFGAGYDNGKASLVGELSTMMYLEEADEPIHVAAVTGAMHLGQATPYLTISRPFGDFFGEDSEIDITNIIFGVRGKL